MSAHSRVDDSSPADTSGRDAIAIAVAELEEGRRRLATARHEVADPRLVMEMQRLVAARQATLDRVIEAIGRSPDVRLSDVTSPEAATARSAVGLASAAGDDGDVVSTLIRGETASIGALRSTLEHPIPPPVDDAVLVALAHVGRTRDQLHLVHP